MTVRRITNLIWKFDGLQKFDCRTKKKSTATKMATTRIVDKPWVIDGLWQNGVEF